MASVNVNQVITGKLLPVDGADDMLYQASWAAQENGNFFRLAQSLQSSLNIEQILQAFYETVKSNLSIKHMSFMQPEDGLEHSFGKAARHSVFYNLKVEANELGALKFTRSKKFTDEDQKTLENLICLLVYPLRNAQQYAQAVNAAVIDPLTGVCNRSTMNEIMQRELDIAKRHDTEFSVLMIDIDDFKKINDTFGHSAGDEVIRLLADCLKKVVRGSDYIFRYGGEEFTVLLNNTDIEGACHLAERLRTAVEDLQFKSGKRNINFTISIGVTAHKQDDSVQRLFNRADKALYVAKKAGKNCVKCMAGLATQP